MPVRIFNSADQVTFDSDQCVNGVCGGSYFVPAGSGFYKDWPLLAGCGLRVVFHHRPDYNNPASVEKGISYPGSVPTISLAPNSTPRLLTVWITGAPTLLNIPGVQAQASNFGVAISPGARGMNYIGRAVFHRDDPANGPYDFPYTWPEANIRYYRIAWHEEPLFAVRLDDGRSVSMTAAYSVGPGLWEIGVRLRDVTAAGVSRPWWSLVADVYAFGRPATPQSSPTFAVWAPDTSLAYDLARPGLLAAHSLCDFASSPWPSGSTGAVPVSRTPVMGVIGNPSYGYEDYAYEGDNQDDSIGQHRWTSGGGAWQWVGGGLAMVMEWHRFQSVSMGTRESFTQQVFQPSTAILVDLTGL
ncbi:UNVERIFIED_ORG: hypothetical protein LHJ69_14105 [Shinella sp. XGS7]|nr:hypothetical protein [Shinella sp. XGS7]